MHAYKYLQDSLQNFDVVFWQQRENGVRFRFGDRLLNVNTWIEAIFKILTLGMKRMGKCGDMVTKIDVIAIVVI